MRNNSFARIAAVALVALAVAVPMFAARGSADFTRFVAIGDSYGAGFESGTLHERHQVFSWPAVIARQVGLRLCLPTATATDNCFAQPLITFPGIPGNELVLNSTGTGLTIIPGQGAPEMLAFGRPYNNLSVPGFTVGATVALKGASSEPGLSPLILRGLGTEVQQAIALNPTFIAVWIGGNDFLGAVSNGSPAGLTSTAAFTGAYNKMLDEFQGKNVQIMGITVESPYADIKPKVKELGMKYMVLVGNDSVEEGFGGMIGYPTTFIVTKDWKIYKKYMGALPDKDARIRKDIEKLLAEDASNAD